MRRAALLAVLILALPIAAFAKSSLVLTNTGGWVQLKGGTLLGSAQFTAFTGSGGTITGNLGQVAYQTGSLTGRTLTASVDTYSFAAGGFFTITSNGSGLPQGTVFTGTFTSPVTFVGTFHPAAGGGAGAWYYTLTGTIAGTIGSGGRGRASGEIVEITFDVPGHVPFWSTVRGHSGGATASTVPEPGTLGLLGTGLVGIACLVRRKFRRPELPPQDTLLRPQEKVELHYS